MTDSNTAVILANVVLLEDISYLKTSQAFRNIPIHSRSLLATILSQLAAL